tara:strand:- start:820 stop:1170 length:351 start_codon:yes stop_codon:yes gene_type:complete
MITLKQKNKTLYLAAQGKVSKTECQEFCNALMKQIDSLTDVRCYVEMINWDDCEQETFSQNVHLNLQNERHLKKVAIVGDPKQQEEFTRFLMPFTKAYIKYFDWEDSISAKEWVEN